MSDARMLETGGGARNLEAAGYRAVEGVPAVGVTVASFNSQVGIAAGASPPATTTIPSPAGVAVGDLLIAFILLDSTSFVADKSTGWSTILGAGIPMYVAGRIADGGANDTLKVGGTNFAPNEDYCVAILRITGHSVTNVTTIPSTSNTGTSVSPDTGGVAAGVAGRLFLAAAYCDRNALETFTGRPTGYTDVATLVSSANSGSSVTLSVAQHANVGTSGEDPSPFTLSSSAPWGCVTLAIPP